MTEPISPQVESLLEYLTESHIDSISVDPTYYFLTLEFSYGSQGYDIIIRLFGVLHFVFSKPLQDKDEDEDKETFFVGKVQLVPITDGGKEIFSSLGYLLKRKNQEFSYPSTPLYYLTVEGEAFVQVVCQSYQVFQEIK